MKWAGTHNLSDDNCDRVNGTRPQQQPFLGIKESSLSMGARRGIRYQNSKKTVRRLKIFKQASKSSEMMPGQVRTRYVLYRCALYSFFKKQSYNQIYNPQWVGYYKVFASESLMSRTRWNICSRLKYKKYSFFYTSSSTLVAWGKTNLRNGMNSREAAGFDFRWKFRPMDIFFVSKFLAQLQMTRCFLRSTTTYSTRVYCTVTSL